MATDPPPEHDLGDDPDHDEPLEDPADEGPSHDRSGLDLARQIARSYRSDDVRPAHSGRRRRRAQRPERAGNEDLAPVGDALSRLIEEQGWAPDLAASRVFADWASIVGPEVAQHCEVVGYADGQVEVQAASTAWATELRLLAPRIVARLNERLGDGSVVRMEVRAPRAPSWKHGRRSVQGSRGPRDTYG